MKVCFNTKFIEGPFGGGMKFALNLKKFLESKGVAMTNHLQDKDIDVILHINPLNTSANVFSCYDAWLYKIKHPKIIIVHRVNECDERKNTNTVNNQLNMVNKYSDYTVYIASWLEPLMKKAGFDQRKPWKVIHNGADEKIFNRQGKVFDFAQNRKLKIVTHHWGANWMKGHDVYKKIDDLLDNEKFKDKFEFTFIGNYPKDIKYRNTKLIAPLADNELAAELKRHDVYITASRNEPAGMHHIEGALCGLPLLYIDSGALPEYCGQFGLEFNVDNIEEKLTEMYNRYEFYLEKLKKYEFTAEKMNENYYDLFKELYKNRENFRYNKKFKILDFFSTEVKRYLSY
jgi:hypothetical protein